jgi:hypothetical protein
MQNWRKVMLKKSVLVVALLLVATNLWAAKTMDVSGTRHNLSSTSTGLSGGNYYAASNEDEVCIFCHTPHGGTMNTPLWNRAVPTGSGFTHYTSATLSGYMRGAGMSTRPVNAESLLCMSCHDGSAAMNSIINNSNRTAAAPDNNGTIIPQFFTTGAAIGDAPDPSGFGTLGHTNNLSDDHPISFSYSSSYNHADNTGEFRAPADAKTSGIRFFGADIATGNFVECSSCHDPHVNHETANGGDADYTPFLVRPNTGSGLCLSCHIK